MGNWKKMTDEQKARACERARLYRATPRAKAMQRERHKRWNAANREKAKAQKAAWYEANRERKRAIDRAWRKAHPDYYRNIYARIKSSDALMADKYAVIKQCREDNKARVREYAKKYQKNYTQKRRLLFASNVEAYQRELARRRDYSRRMAEAEGREYRPRLAMRKPSWAVYGIDSHLSGREPFRTNHDAARLSEFDGYARGLAISRKENNQ